MPLPTWLFSTLLSRSPSVCAVCHSWPAHAVCDDCVARFAHASPRCKCCAQAVPESVSVCGACLIRPPALNACLTAVGYAYPWDTVIAAFKFRAQPSWARAMAHLMQSTPLAQEALDQADWILPIPLFDRRLRERGYNQAWELVRHLRSARPKADPNLLLRIVDSAPQVQQDRASRQRNLQNAFFVEPLRHQAVQNRRIVLVDDVMTTGSTLNAAAAALRAAGASHVTGLVFARTDKKSS